MCDSPIGAIFFKCYSSYIYSIICHNYVHYIHWQHLMMANHQQTPVIITKIGLLPGTLGINECKWHVEDDHNDIWYTTRSTRVKKLMHSLHDGVITWKHFPRYWPFVWRIHRSAVNSPHKGQWRDALMFSLICAWINGWVNNGEASDLKRHRAHYDVTVMIWG